MANTIIVIITIIAGVLYGAYFWLGYKKEKAEDQGTKTKIAKWVFIVAASMVVVLYVVNPLVNVLSRKEELATKKDFKEFREEVLNKLFVPLKSRSRMKLINSLKRNLKKRKKELRRIPERY